MAATSVFISFNYDMNRYFKNLLVSWDKNHEFAFEFYDASLRDLFDSANGDYVRSKLKAMIQGAAEVLFVIGEKCSRSKWVEWEAQTAFEMGKPVAAVKVDPSCATPQALMGPGVRWAPSFTFEAIKAAVASVPVVTSAPPAAHPPAAA